MAAFSIRQNHSAGQPPHLNIGSSNNSTYRVFAITDPTYFPPAIGSILTSTFITPEIQAHFQSLIEAEYAAVRLRQAYVSSLAQSLQPQVEAFLADLPTSHPELYL